LSLGFMHEEDAGLRVQHPPPHRVESYRSLRQAADDRWSHVHRCSFFVHRWQSIVRKDRAGVARSSAFWSLVSEFCSIRVRAFDIRRSSIDTSIMTIILPKPCACHTRRTKCGREPAEGPRPLCRPSRPTWADARGRAGAGRAIGAAPPSAG